MRSITNEELFVVAGGDGSLDTLDSLTLEPQFGGAILVATGGGDLGGGADNFFDAMELAEKKKVDTIDKLIDKLADRVPSGELICKIKIKGNKSEVVEWEMECTGTLKSGAGKK